MITILTRSRNPFTKEFLKWAARKITRKYSGPKAVEDSLLRGLKKLNVPYELNKMAHQNGTVIVLAGVQALKEALAQKKSGVIKTLIAGPNILLSPEGEDGIMLDPAIDIVLVPAQWVKEFWASEAPELEKKLRVWPSGVSISGASNHAGRPVIYNKIKNRGLLESTTRAVETRADSPIIFTYGSFKRKDYLDALVYAPYVIYLAQSESQGLALQEAWARDVPTLVNHSTQWKSGSHLWTSPQINCPYLTPELGRIFNDAREIPRLIDEITLLHPKKYCDKNLSDETSTKLLFDIIHKT